MAFGFFDKAMNFLGLVETDGNGKNNRRSAADDDFERIDRRGKNNGSTRRVKEDEFDEEPRITYVPRRGGSGTGSTSPAGNTRRGAQSGGSDFEAEEIWGETPVRPEYSPRTGSGAQNPQRGTAPRSGAVQGSYRSPYQTQSEPRPGTKRTTYPETNYYGGESSMNFGEQYGSSNTTQKQQTSSAIAMIRIKTVDECKNVIRTLLEKKSVLLSLEEMDSVQAQRVVDTMSGATFAIGAKMNRASARSWLLTPSTVEVDDKHAIQSNTIL